MALNLLDRISAMANDLSKSERKIAAAVLAQPQLTVSESIAQLAKRAEVSEPTVCRFCKRFGANGFPDFKLALGATMAKDSHSLPDRVKRGDSVEDVANKVIDTTVAMLRDLSRTVDLTVLARTVDLLSQSRRVIVAAQGLSAAAALDCGSRLLRLGIACETVTDSSLMRMSCASLRQGDLLIAISATGRSLDVLSAVKIARQNGAAIVAVCPDKTPISAESILTLKCGQFGDVKGDDLMIGRMMVQTMLQIVIAGVMLRRADAISPLKDALTKAQELSYIQSEDSPVLAVEEKSESTKELKPHEPITTIAFDWT
ncbi:SIS domain-containing protein [uncultured Succinatimonas sp.]|uniref:SIS domain-containing protein n=1 Tax=uncultured Succinatimonas sp. TaxID=1262973 RepID=UPI0025F83F53|nr:SIS domain-containing protein [uncultured Succinatimonas sp.]